MTKKPKVSMSRMDKGESSVYQSSSSIIEEHSGVV